MDMNLSSQYFVKFLRAKIIYLEPYFIKLDNMTQKITLFQAFKRDYSLMVFDRCGETWDNEIHNLYYGAYTKVHQRK